jgi:hypothetical protein
MGTNLKDCFNCGCVKEQIWNWFCNRCTRAKEAAYAACRDRGVKTWPEVLEAREVALREARGGGPVGSQKR